MLKVLLNIEPQKTKGVVGAPWKTVSKRVKVSSVQLAVWGGDVPVTASP